MKNDTGWIYKLIGALFVVILMFILCEDAWGGQVTFSSLPTTIAEGNHSAYYNDSVSHTIDTLTLTDSIIYSDTSGLKFSATFNWFLQGSNDTIAFCSSVTAWRTKGIECHGVCTNIVIDDLNVIQYAQHIDTTVSWSGSPDTSVTNDTLTGRAVGVAFTGISSHSNTFQNGYVEVNGYSSHCVQFGGEHSQLLQYTNVESKSCGFKSRGSYDGSVIHADKLWDSAYIINGDATYHGRIYDVNVIRGPYSSFVAGATQASGFNAMQVEACTLVVDAWNIMYPASDGQAEHGTANCYGVHTVRQGRGFIKDCKITSGSAHKGGRGIMLERPKGISTDTVKVTGNEIVSHESACVAFAGGAHAYYPTAMKIRTDPKGLYVANNDMTYIANGDVPYDSVEQNSNAYHKNGHGFIMELNVWAVCDTPYNVTIENNTIRAKDAGENAYIDGMHFEVWTCGYWPPSIVIQNNRIESDSIGCGWGGLDNEDADYIRMVGDTFILVDTGNSSHVMYSMGYLATGLDAERTIFQDITYMYDSGSGAVATTAYDTNIVFPDGTAIANMTLKETLDFLIINLSNNPIENVIITVENNFNDTVITDTTNVNGEASGIAKYWYEYRGGSGSNDSVFNNHIITAKLASDSVMDTLTVDCHMDVDTLQLAIGGASNYIDISGLTLQGLEIK